MKMTLSVTTPHTSQLHDHLELEQSNIQFYVVHWPTDKLKVSRSAVVHNQLCVAMNTVEHFREVCVGARDVHVCNSEHNIYTLSDWTLANTTRTWAQKHDVLTSATANTSGYIYILSEWALANTTTTWAQKHICSRLQQRTHITHLRDEHRRTFPGPEPWNTWCPRVHQQTQHRHTFRMKTCEHNRESAWHTRWLYRKQPSQCWHTFGMDTTEHQRQIGLKNRRQSDQLLLFRR